MLSRSQGLFVVSGLSTLFVHDSSDIIVDTYLGGMPSVTNSPGANQNQLKKSAAPKNKRCVRCAACCEVENGELFGLRLLASFNSPPKFGHSSMVPESRNMLIFYVFFMFLSPKEVKPCWSKDSNSGTFLAEIFFALNLITWFLFRCWAYAPSIVGVPVDVCYDNRIPLCFFVKPFPKVSGRTCRSVPACHDELLVLWGMYFFMLKVIRRLSSNRDLSAITIALTAQVNHPQRLFCSWLGLLGCMTSPIANGRGSTVRWLWPPSTSGESTECLQSLAGGAQSHALVTWIRTSLIFITTRFHLKKMWCKDV